MLNMPLSNGITPLMTACSAGNIPIIKILLQNPKIKLNKIMANATTALMIACIKGKKEVVKLLLGHKNTNLNMISCDPYGKQGGTAFSFAIMNKHFDIGGLLLNDSKFKVNKILKIGTRGLNELSIVLMVAYPNSQLQLDHVKQLLAAGADSFATITTEQNEKLTALNLAARNGLKDIVHYLVQWNKKRFPNVAEITFTKYSIIRNAWEQLFDFRLEKYVKTGVSFVDLVNSWKNFSWITYYIAVSTDESPYVLEARKFFEKMRLFLNIDFSNVTDELLASEAIPISILQHLYIENFETTCYCLFSNECRYLERCLKKNHIYRIKQRMEIIDRIMPGFNSILNNFLGESFSLYSYLNNDDLESLQNRQKKMELFFVKYPTYLAILSTSQNAIRDIGSI